MFPAFKEWQVIVEALGSGEQVLILRKGGIAEGLGGFDAAHAGRFWLFPTHFHAQREKTKPSAAKFGVSPSVDSTTTLTLHYFADIVRHRFIERWEDVAGLNTFHFWTETTIREKFDWSRPPGLHCMVIRVHRLHRPVTLPITPMMSGCKSWIDLPVSFDAQQASPVLDDDAFAARLKQLTLIFPPLS